MEKSRGAKLFPILLMALLATPAAAQETPLAAAAAPETAPVQQNLQQGGVGDLLIAPTRVVLDNKTRASEVILSNKGSATATYRVGLAHMRQQADGSYKELTPEEAKASLPVADELIRFSPRQVTLKGGESQVVKIMMRKPEGLADGEYTSHMSFRAVPDMATGEDVEAKKSEDGQIAIRIIPVYGVTIPVLVRSGSLTSQGKIQSAARNGDNVLVTIARTGNASVYGDVFITQGNNVVGQTRGVGVLSYIPARSVNVPVTGSGPVTVEYRQRMEEGGKVLDKIQVN